MPDAPDGAPLLRRLLVAACIAAAAIRVALPILAHVALGPGFGDFASYYYGARVALSGGSPYDLAALNELAKAEIGRPVNPYIYPPPFLLVMAPLAALPVRAARLVWLAVETATMAAALVALRRILASVGDPGNATLLVAVALATFAPLYENLVMGQVNLLVMLLVLAGLRRLLDGKEGACGVLLGAATVAKMSPALLLLWLALKGRWRALGGAAAAAVALTAVSLPVVGLAATRQFYLEVLPDFSQRFPQVRLRVDWIGNHSLPSAWNALFPGDHPMRLSPVAQGLAAASAMVLLSAAAWRCRRATKDSWELLGEASIVLVLMVALPVFTFDHHLVHLLLPLGIAALALARGALPLAFWPSLGIAYAFLALPPSELIALEKWGAPTAWEPLLHLARKSKLAAMGILAVVLWIRRRTSPGDGNIR